MNEEVAKPKTWVHRRHLEDGTWVIDCTLCGKRFKRVFRVGEYNDARLAAADYVGEHLDSPAHKAAVQAYRDVPNEQLSAEQKLLRTAFGSSDKRVWTNEQLRLASARRAAESVPRAATPKRGDGCHPVAKGRQPDGRYAVTCSCGEEFVSSTRSVSQKAWIEHSDAVKSTPRGSSRPTGRSKDC